MLDEMIFELQEKLHNLSSQRCFSQDASREPVSVLSIYPRASDPDVCQSEHQHLTEPQEVQRLPGTQSNHASTDYIARLICLSQSNSFRRVNVSQQTMEAILREHQITTAFLDVASCFFHKVLNLEEALGVPFQQFQNQDYVEYMYVLKYPEETHRDWSIRQMGVYHQVRLRDQRSTFVLITAYPTSVARDRLIQWLKNSTSSAQIREQCLKINQIILPRHIADWRGYMRHYESEVERLSVRMLTAGLTDLNGVTPNDVADLSFTERRLVPVDAILASTVRLLQNLGNFVRLSPMASAGPMALDLAQICANNTDTIAGYRDNMTVLLLKCASTQGVLNNILSLNNQRVAQQQNDRVFYLTTSTVDDSATVRVITAITLVFLSFTAVAAVMAMPLFYLEETDRTLTVSPSFWVYIAISVPLTAALLAYWRFMLYLKRRKRKSMLKIP